MTGEPVDKKRRRARQLPLLMLVGALLCACADTSSEQAPDRGPEPVNDAGMLEPCLACGETTTCTEEVPVESANHVSDPRTDDPAPAGGDHHPCWADYGVYDTELAAQYWVHNLEHGAIVFLYHCPQGCPEDIAALEALTEGRPRALVTEYPYMTARFAAVSWGRRLAGDCLDADAMADFYEAHVDRAPEYVTSGAPAGCPTKP